MYPTDIQTFTTHSLHVSECLSQHCLCQPQTSPTQMSRNSRMDTSWYIHSHTGTSLRDKTCTLSQNNNTEESYKHYVEQKKPGTKNYIRHNFIMLKRGPNQCMVRDVSLAVTLGGWVAPERSMRGPLDFCQVLFLDLVLVTLCHFKTIYQAAHLHFVYVSIARFYVN